MAISARQVRTPIAILVSLALALLLFATTGEAQAQAAFTCDKWASVSGNDANDGTKENPVQTVRTLASKLQPGETGCLTAGETFHMEGGWGIISQSGLAGSPITIRSAPEGRAILTGLMRIDGSHITLRDINFRGLAAAGDTDPKTNHILVNGGDGVSILNNDITSPKGICISVGRIKSYTPENHIDQDMDPSKDFKLDGNRIYGCGVETDLVLSDSGMHGVYLAYTHDAQITNNYIYDNRVRGLQLYPRSERTLVEHNVLDGNSGNLNIGGSEHEDGYFNSRDTIVRNNIISNSTFAWHKDSAQVFGNYKAGIADNTYNNLVTENCIYHQDSSKNFSGSGITQTNNKFVDPLYKDRVAKNFAVQAPECAGMGPQTGTVVDPIAPTITDMLPANGSNTTDTRPPFSATVKDDSTLTKANIKLYVNGTLMGDTRYAYNSATGELTRVFEDGIDPDFTNGSHTIRIVATDAQGLSADESTTFTVGTTPSTCLGENTTRVGDDNANTISGIADTQDVVDARGGNDTIQDFANGLINKPYDRFCGGDGEDTFKASSELGDPVVMDGGNDSAGLVDNHSDIVSYKLWTRSPGGTNNGVWVDLGNASPTGDGGGYVEALGLDHILHNISDVEGTLRNDSIDGNEKSNSLYGIDGNDRLVGKAGRDYLEGGAGNDSIDAADGESDTVMGGSGQDTINTQDGVKDTVNCGDGAFDSAEVDVGLDVVSNCESADTTPPEGTVTIDGGKATTRDRAVVLNLLATDPAPGSGVAQMRFSHNGETWKAWETYATKKKWTLKKGKSGTRVVYAQFMDGADNPNQSAVVSDTIRYRR